LLLSGLSRLPRLPRISAASAKRQVAKGCDARLYDALVGFNVTLSELLLPVLMYKATDINNDND